MQEVIERLQDLNEDRYGSVELPEFDQLVEIEEELLISLPGELKDFLMTVSNVAYGAIEPVTVTDPNLHTYLPEVASQAWNIGLPRSAIPVCQTSEGFYAINLEGQIAYWKEGDFTDDEWPSIWHWAKDVWLKE